MILEDMLRDINLVSWDVDGTLFSFFDLALALSRNAPARLWTRGWADTLEALAGVRQFHRAVEFQRRRDRSRAVSAELSDYEEVRAEERAAIERALVRVRPRRHALGLLEQFRRAGVRQVAWSDFECGYKLRALNLESYFEDAYSSEVIGFWKPSPVSLARIQADFGVRPEHHLHIGDRMDTDGEASRRNGCSYLPIDASPRLWSILGLIGGMGPGATAKRRERPVAIG